MAELYWIRHPTHTDMFSEGYIGITKHTSSVRFKGHKKAATHTKRKNNTPVYNAIRKYGEHLIVQTLVVSGIEYISALEEILRPDVKIGWNIRQGGQKGRNVGTKHSKESKLKMKAIQKEVHQRPDVIAKRAMVILNRRSPVAHHLDCEGKPFKFWATRYTKGRFPELWENIPILWDIYNKNNIILSAQVLKQSDSYSSRSRAFVNKILDCFRTGWNPLEDSLYLEDFPIGT
jgi:hypothetical protein